MPILARCNSTAETQAAQVVSDKCIENIFCQLASSQLLPLLCIVFIRLLGPLPTIVAPGMSSSFSNMARERLNSVADGRRAGINRVGAAIAHDCVAKVSLSVMLVHRIHVCVHAVVLLFFHIGVQQDLVGNMGCTKPVAQGNRKKRRDDGETRIGGVWANAMLLVALLGVVRP